MTWKILGLFLVGLAFVRCSNYEQVYLCNGSSANSYALFSDLDRIDLHEIDAFYFIIVGPIAVLICLFFLISMLLNFDLLKKQPGDLYFGATVSELILAVHWTLFGSKSIYDRFSGLPPATNDGDFCQINAFISIYAGTWEMLYNICFCVYLIQKMRTLMDPVAIPSTYYHITACMISFIFTFVLYKTGNLGKNLFGTCSFVADSKVPYLGPIVLVFYYIFAFYAIFYFKHYIPESLDNPARQSFLRYYYRYLWATTIVWIPVVLTNIISSLNCAYIQKPLLDIALTVGNINKLNTPIFLTVVRMLDHKIKNRMGEIYRKIRNRNKDPDDFSIFVNSELNEPIMDGIQRQDVLTLVVDRKTTTMNKSINHEASNELSTNTLGDPFDNQSRKTSSNMKVESENDIEQRNIGDYWLTLLTESAKALYLKAMIMGILVNVRKLSERKSSKNFSFFNLTDFTEKSRKKKLEKNCFYLLDSNVVKREFPDIWEKEGGDFENLEVRITYYSPKLFDELMINDISFLNLDSSLAIDRNVEQIKNSSRADGGRGGQFFFFSSDNQIILKSLSPDDFKCMKKILLPYYEYMAKNHDSLITRIYGIYEFSFFTSKNKKCAVFSQKMMIMRNLCGYPKCCIDKIYDLKGSTFQRESLLKKQLKENMVLKDIDFLKLEKRLYIDAKRKEALLDTLKRDSLFFKSNGIIDYSLLIIKINCNRIDDYFQTPTVDGLWSLDSTKEKGVKYQIGIIDYLQPYNYKKILEKYSKKLLKARINLDTSAQDPIIYSNRFCKFLEKILEEEKE